MCLPVLDGSLARVILGLTSVDVSIADGILMFRGGQVQHKHVDDFLSFPRA